jgi:hypothetical protein
MRLHELIQGVNEKPIFCDLDQTKPIHGSKIRRLEHAVREAEQGAIQSLLI